MVTCFFKTNSGTMFFPGFSTSKMFPFLLLMTNSPGTPRRDVSPSTDPTKRPFNFPEGVNARPNGIASAPPGFALIVIGAPPGVPSCVRAYFEPVASAAHISATAAPGSDVYALNDPMRCPERRSSPGRPPSRAVSNLAPKYQIAFYGSTPIYAKALEAEGWGDLHPTLRQMTRENRWMEMVHLITDEMCERFAVVGEPQEIGPKLVERFGPWVDRLSIVTTYRLEPECASRIVSDIHSLTAGRDG